VSGQVVLNGAPLSDVTVVLRPQRPTSSEEAKGVEAKSDDDGNYRITDVAAGHYSISVLTPGFVTTAGAGSDLPGKISHRRRRRKTRKHQLRTQAGGSYYRACQRFKRQSGRQGMDRADKTRRRREATAFPFQPPGAEADG